MNEASTSISMELIPGAYEQPIICDGDSCSFDYEGTWIGCDDPWTQILTMTISLPEEIL